MQQEERNMSKNVTEKELVFTVVRCVRVKMLSKNIQSCVKKEKAIHKLNLNKKDENNLSHAENVIGS